MPEKAKEFMFILMYLWVCHLLAEARVIPSVEHKKLNFTSVLCQTENSDAEVWKKLVAYVDEIVSNIPMKVEIVNCTPGRNDALSKLQQPVVDLDICEALKSIEVNRGRNTGIIAKLASALAEYTKTPNGINQALERCRASERWKQDITFVLCQSENTEAEVWKEFLEYVDKIVSNMTTGPDPMKVAVMSCVPGMTDFLIMDAYMYKDSIKDSLSQLEPPVGHPDLCKTLNFLHSEIYMKAGDASRKIVLFLLHGFGNGSDEVREAAERCHVAEITTSNGYSGEQDLLNTEEASDFVENHYAPVGYFSTNVDEMVLYMQYKRSGKNSKLELSES